jgi:bifunctional N-acetylglucosamine-1-phosphate-uridyltransferase/glucosamine-1-phosphate-acetyltransferase GlmU-like protein
MVGDPFLEPDISESALVDAFCTIDAGVPGLPTTRVGNYSWLQKRVHMGHNARVGNDCEICVGVVVCGEVVVGNGVQIGGNSWLKPQITVGDGAIIGGGSVVTKDVPAHEVWAGNPARFMKIAWTHPDYNAQRGLEGRERAYAQYDMTATQWETARAAVLWPPAEEVIAYEAAQSGWPAGHGVGVAGDHA